MRIKTILLSAAVTVALAGVANANTIVLNDSYGSGAGGEFKVTTFDGDYASSGAGVLDSGSLFQTFCIENDEYITFGSSYQWDLNTAAVGGGSGGPSPDPLGFKTAYLFTQFWNGTLSNYDYGSPVPRDADGTALQRVLWYLENEIGADDGTQATANAYFGGAGTQEALWYKEATDAGWTSIGNVRVLNLFTTNSPRVEHQDVLVVVPTPQAALAGMSLLASMGVIGYMRRRSQKELL